MASRGAASSEHLERLHDIFRGLHADLGGAAQRLRHGAAGGCCRRGRPGTGWGCDPQRPGLASRRHSREGAGAGGRGEPGGWAGPGARAASRSRQFQEAGLQRDFVPLRKGLPVGNPGFLVQRSPAGRCAGAVQLGHGSLELS